MDRRSFIATSAVTLTAAGLAHAADTARGAGNTASAGSDLSSALGRCLAAAYACREHCQAMLEKGDTMMAACMRTVSDMIPLCEATQKLAASKSRHLKRAVAVCLDACIECEAECKKHASMSDVCKTCLDACTACIAACKKV